MHIISTVFFTNNYKIIDTPDTIIVVKNNVEYKKAKWWNAAQIYQCIEFNNKLYIGLVWSGGNYEGLLEFDNSIFSVVIPSLQHCNSLRIINNELIAYATHSTLGNGFFNVSTGENIILPSGNSGVFDFSEYKDTNLIASIDGQLVVYDFINLSKDTLYTHDNIITSFILKDSLLVLFDYEKGYIIKAKDTSSISSINTQELINQVQIFPNPSKGYFSIDYGEKIKKITIINSLGQIVLEDNNYINGKNININKLSNGNYFLIIESQKNIITKQLVKI